MKNRRVLRLIVEPWFVLTFLGAYVLVVLQVSVWKEPPEPAIGGPGLFAEFAHVGMYAGLGMLLRYCGFTLHARREWLAIAASILLAGTYGAFMEFLQLQIPEREGSWEDVGLNVLGATFGTVCWVLGNSILRRHILNHPKRQLARQ